MQVDPVHLATYMLAGLPMYVCKEHTISCVVLLLPALLWRLMCLLILIIRHSYSTRAMCDIVAEEQAKLHLQLRVLAWKGMNYVQAAGVG